MGRLKNRLLAKLFTRFPRLLDRLVEKTEAVEVSGIPWAPMKKRLSECKVAIVTTAGVHLKSQMPFDMKDPHGDPSYRALASDTPKGNYTITHDYYDHSDADKDLNVVFPVFLLKELAAQGVIGSVAAANYGFMGHIDGPYVDTLIKKTAPEVAAALKREKVDAAVLTPG